ncbi:MAG: hypothetical protein ACI9RI_000875 [Oceanospirillaceae bacterium]|jgi:hypothetical protein
MNKRLVRAIEIVVFIGAVAAILAITFGAY